LSDLLAEFTVYGNPKPKQRPRHGQGRTFTPKATVIAEDAVRAAYRAAYPLAVPTIENIRLEADFYRATGHHVDGDNLYKLVTDALNKVAYVDDTQITEGEFRRFYGAGDNARTVIRITITDLGENT
jgi:crossover junction endodeoxyribonuclease RusA